MRKLRLEMDALRVQSFAAAPEMDAPRGTVRGHGTGQQMCNPFTHDTRQESCHGTCPQPCADTEGDCW